MTTVLIVNGTDERLIAAVRSALALATRNDDSTVIVVDRPNHDSTEATTSLAMYHDLFDDPYRRGFGTGDRLRELYAVYEDPWKKDPHQHGRDANNVLIARARRSAARAAVATWDVARAPQRDPGRAEAVDASGERAATRGTARRARARVRPRTRPALRRRAPAMRRGNRPPAHVAAVARRRRDVRTRRRSRSDGRAIRNRGRAPGIDASPAARQPMPEVPRAAARRALPPLRDVPRRRRITEPVDGALASRYVPPRRRRFRGDE